jgi:signal transduction histidine kinase
MTSPSTKELNGHGNGNGNGKPHMKGKPHQAENGHSTSDPHDSDIKMPVTFLGNDQDVAIDKASSSFRRGAQVTFAMWCTLVYVVMNYSPADSFEQAEGHERTLFLFSFLLLLVSNISNAYPLFLHDQNFDFLKSGVLQSAFTVQCMAMATDFILFAMPTPVMFDEFSGMRVHLLRWATWTCLAFLMTFLTCNVDAPIRHTRANFLYPVLLALSTACGLVFPFCETLAQWRWTMVVSWVLFMALFVLVYSRAVNYHRLKRRIGKKMGPNHNDKNTNINTSNSVSVAEKENLDLARASYTLGCISSVSWTLLAVAFTVLTAIPTINVAEHWMWLKSPSVVTWLMSIHEVISKIMYLTVLIRVYDSVFDHDSRAVRRLEDLRHFMSAVWTSSSDPIVFCVRNEHGPISARVSPAFPKMLGLSIGRSIDRDNSSLVLEIFPEEDYCYAFAVDLSKSVGRGDILNIKQDIKTRRFRLSSTAGLSTDHKNLVLLALLALKATKARNAQIEVNLMETFFRTSENGEIGVVCEAKLTGLESSEQSCVLMFRDISDRLERFEFEKKLVQEQTSRQKDAEANKFTRHEVKNGILAAIHLLDHLRETMERKGILESSQDVPPRGGDNSGENGSHGDEVEESVAELDSTLRDILNTILDEAMAREIIYGEYLPRTEQVDVPDVFDAMQQRALPRFPLVTVPDPFPCLVMDRQLLRYIYRNAVSNACRYGKTDGVVETMVKYDASEQMLTMQVVNLPGEGHDQLVKLSATDVSSVFHQGKQLQVTHSIGGTTSNSVLAESSGNGAWIMQKCAQTMGGICSIRFDASRTTFTFSCMAPQVIGMVGKVKKKKKMMAPPPETDYFSLPDNTWGIVVDDRFFTAAGIEKSRRVLLGATASEVFGFADAVKDLMAEYPEDKFLLVADENLDIVSGGAHHQTVSGSLCVSKLLSELDYSTEKRLLALIRSANDSARDIEIYKSRAHGFLLKEPIQKGGALDLIKPWWLSRFPETVCSRAARLPDLRIQIDEQGPLVGDVRETLKIIYALSSVVSQASLKRRWSTIQDKLHALKGDLMTLIAREELLPILEELSSLRSSPRYPPDFSKRWAMVATQVEAMLE